MSSITKDQVLKTLATEDLFRFYSQWKVQELALFGSALHGNLREDSDIDLLVTFQPNADWSLLDHVKMEKDLEALLGREVDLVSRRAIERSANWIRRKAILDSAQTVYVAG